MAKQRINNRTLCPECDGLISLNGRLTIGQHLSCVRCGSWLEVTDRNPVELVVVNRQYSGKSRVKTTKKGKRKLLIGGANNYPQRNGELKEDQPLTSEPTISISECPECDSRLRFRKTLKVGELILCPECNVALEVVSLKPLELDWADEDPWDYEDRDDPQIRSSYRLI
ncbi:MAG TPA: hypothetical protein VFI27_16035 [candidate division Zixibacteria bacterium]|nr:hypothetical protein [candidate division Zixibacteria bacterium]